MAPETNGLHELKSGELQIDSTVDAECLRLVWRGRSAAPDPRAVLIPYFEQALDVAHRSGTRLEMHFQSLDYFNSSTIAALIDAIRLGGERRVPMTMIYKAAVRWQRMSFDALRMFIGEYDFQLKAV